MNIVKFVKDWNSGMTVPDLAKKYKLSEASVRSTATSLRRKGVNVENRKKKGIVASLSEKDVAEINKQIG